MSRRMDNSLVILLVLVVCLSVFAGIKDHTLPLEGLYASGRLFGSVWIELLLGFLIAGLLEVLIPPAEITAWLGTESFTRGILIGWLAGLAIPGGPYLLFPIAAKLWAAGAAPGVLIALITAKSLVSPIRMLTYEAPLLGWPLTLARCIPALFVPPIMGMLARIIHERFCCTRRSAVATSLWLAGSPLRPSTYCTSTLRILRAPRKSHDAVQRVRDEPS